MQNATRQGNVENRKFYIEIYLESEGSTGNLKDPHDLKLLQERWKLDRILRLASSFRRSMDL